MSSPRTRIVTLNLGSQSIELAEFRAEPQRLILCGYCSRELLVEPAKQEVRLEQMSAALREMLSELRITGGSVNYTVAEELVFSRFVKLPALGKEKVERIIAFEAQHNVPFPLDEVVWDYQLVGGGLGEQIQVVLVAIKADLLDEINRAVEETGLRTAIVDLAPMALYNAFCYNYAGLSGCSLLVDIGARTTNLVFIEPGRIFTRSIALGGISITAAIAKEFNEPFAAAELRKKRDGMTSRGVESLNGDDISRVSKIVCGTMTRLHAEVMRSISHYCAQQTGNPPARIFLAGGGACTSGLREFFQEKMGLPVEFFNPLRNVAVLDSARVEEIARAAHLLGEPVGLALRSRGDCPMQLNLRPASVVRRRELDKRRPPLVAAAACLLLGVLAWGAYFWHSTQLKERATAQLHEKVVAMRRVETQMNQVRKEIAALDNLSKPLVAAISDRAFWPSVLEDLNARLPKQDIWITELVPTSAGKPLGVSDARAVVVPSVPPRPGATPSRPAADGLLVRGLYLFNSRQQEVVVDYFKNLAESPWFALDPKNQAKAIKPTTPNNTEWAFPYELRLDLKKPVPLP